jgi:uncharacterized lipoprotein YajG
MNQREFIAIIAFQTFEMKKLFVLFIAISMMVACNNSSTTDATNAPTTVENVNGNTPDSTNSTNLNNPLPIDSSRVKDSTKK